MALKDLYKAEKSIFIVAIGVIVLVGLGLLLLISESEPTRTELTEREEVEQEVDEQDETDGATRRVTGVVTELFKDCQEKLVLEDGEVVVSDDPVSCDGGSFFTVDGQQVYYQSGYVAQEDAYSYDIGELTPGDTVEVTYQVNEYGGTDLNCEACEVTVLQ